MSKFFASCLFILALTACGGGDYEEESETKAPCPHPGKEIIRC